MQRVLSIYSQVLSLQVLSSDEFCERLLFEEKVAVVPGTAFGKCGEGHIRCSYAYSIDEIKKALKKIAHFVEKVRNEKNV